jgi:sugar-specific transcriptional regulator TrmB
MKNGLIEGLLHFGLSVNQAKVYLNIVESQLTSVNSISKATGIHRQDIYKMLPKLEKMGLITQTQERPTVINNIPVYQALSSIINTEQQKTNDRIKHMKSCVKKLANDIENTKILYEVLTPEDEVMVAFLSSDRAIKNRLDAAYTNAKKQCVLVMDVDLIMRRVPFLRKRFKALATNNVKTRFIVGINADARENQDLVKKTLEEILPKTGDFAVKFFTNKIEVKPYLIFDKKDIYIPTKKKTELFFPCIICTNSQRIIKVYEEKFESTWNASSTSVIRPATQQGRKPHPTVSKASFV